MCGQFDLVRRNGTAHTNYSPGFCFNIPPPASVCKEGNSADCPTAAVKHSFEGRKKKSLGTVIHAYFLLPVFPAELNFRKDSERCNPVILKDCYCTISNSRFSVQVQYRRNKQIS